jgi:hypothetical protein
MAGKRGRSGRRPGACTNLWYNPKRACSHQYKELLIQEEMQTGHWVALHVKKQLATRAIADCARIYAEMSRFVFGVEKPMAKPTVEEVMREARRRRLPARWPLSGILIARIRF